MTTAGGFHKMNKKNRIPKIMTIHNLKNTVALGETKFTYIIYYS